MKWSRIVPIYDRLLDIMTILAALLLLFITLAVFFDALGRYFFNTSSIWTIKVTEYSLLYITFLGAAWLLRREGHVSIELVVEKFSERVQSILGMISSIICAIVYCFFFVYGLIVGIDHWMRGIYDPGMLKFPKGPVIMIIPIGSLFLIIQFLRRAYKFYRSQKSNDALI